jgi:hypothetical protein
LGEGVAYACATVSAVPCLFGDAVTRLFFTLPRGWSTDQRTREAVIAGGQPGPVRITFFSTGDPVETIALNPRQRTTRNGPCLDMQAGASCRFENCSEEMTRAIDILTRVIRDMQPREATATAAAQAVNDGTGEDAGSSRAWPDYPFRHLPGDKTQPICEMGCDPTGLSFLLPENWVADVTVDIGGLRPDLSRSEPARSGRTSCAGLAASQSCNRAGHR